GVQTCALPICQADAGEVDGGIAAHGFSSGLGGHVQIWDVVLARVTRVQGRRVGPLSFSPPIMRMMRRPASSPSARKFMSTLVSGGRDASAMMVQLSKPTRA